MTWTFIALEDPLSIKGGRRKATGKKEKQREKKAPRTKKGQQGREKEAPQTKVEQRQQFLAEYHGALDYGQLDDDEIAVNAYCRDHEAFSSRVRSLNQAVHAICPRAERRRDKLGTLIFIGHGSESGISVGIGQGPIGSAFSDDASPEDLKAVKERAIDLFRIYDRMIGFNNLDQWVALFASIKNAVGEDGNGRFNVVLLGCSTGEWRAGTGDILVDFVAKNVYAALGKEVKVAVFGLSNSVDQAQTAAILDHLDTIKAANDKDYVQIPGHNDLWAFCAHCP